MRPVMLHILQTVKELTGSGLTLVSTTGKRNVGPNS